MNTSVKRALDRMAAQRIPSHELVHYPQPDSPAWLVEEQAGTPAAVVKRRGIAC
jgi:hypothetical protein